jgi:dihydroflavonol-4-reductase
MFDVNVTGTQNLLFACQRAGVERVVYTSSIAALGLHPDRPSDEETEFNQVRQANDYVLSKWLSEEVARGFARQGLPVVIASPAFPFGARDVGPTPTGKILLDVVKGKYPGYFDAGFNVVDVEDVARGHLLAEEKGQPGRRYLLSGTNMTMKEFMVLVARLAGVRVKLRRIPIALACWYGDWLDRRADKVQRPPLLSGRSLRYASQNLYYDNSRTRAELGLELTPIETSIRRALEWFREHGHLRPAG